MPQAKVVLAAPCGLTDDLMQIAIHKLCKLGTLEGDQIGVYSAERPEGGTASRYLEFRASVIPYLGRH